MFGLEGNWTKWLPVALVVAILIYLYTISPESKTITAISTPDNFANWTRYTGMYGEGVNGHFKGTVSDRRIEEKRWNGMRGIFEGECYRSGQTVRCWMNISNGGYAGSSPLGYIGNDNNVDVNLTGTALGWDVQGYILPINEYKPVSETPTNWNNLILIGLLIIVVFYLWKSQGRGRYTLDDAAIAKKLQKYLREGWSKELDRVVEFHRWPESGIAEKTNIFFLLKEPYHLTCLCRYDFSSSVFMDFKFGCSYSEYKQFMNPAVKLIQDKKTVWDKVKDGEKP